MSSPARLPADVPGPMQFKVAVETLEAAILSRPADELPSIAGELRRLDALIALRFAVEPKAPAMPADRVLKVADVAKRLGQSEAWVYDHADELPRLKGMPGGGVKFSERGLESWLKRRSG